MGASTRADVGAPTRPLAWLQTHLVRLGVTASSNGTIVEAGMRGRGPLYVRWDRAGRTFAWDNGGERGEPMTADPARAAEQVMARLVAPPAPWPRPNRRA